MNSNSSSAKKSHTTRVKKRDGTLEDVSFDKITARISTLVGYDENTCLDVNPIPLAQEVITRIKDGIETKTLDSLAARKAHNKMLEHPDWDTLAGRVSVSNYHKETYGCGHVFSEIMREFHKDNKISDKTWDVVQMYDRELDDAIDYDRDYDTTYLGFKRFEHTYAIRFNGKPIERRQDMFMRQAIGIHGDEIDDVLETYEWTSCGYFTHATPTLFNAGTPKPQCSSCFLIAMKEEKDKYPFVDSIEKIYETLSDCAKISKCAGGIGLSISNVRPRGSIIRSVGRKGRGIVPMLKNFNETARYVDQGLRRKGAFAAYLEPWHADILEFLQLKEPMGQDEMRARDLHYAVWVPNLFMRRCENDEMWSLMDPSVCPELINLHSEKFDAYYEKCEKEGKFMRQVRATEILKAIITCQIHTGQPYVLFKDHCNRKSNQQNLGTIRSSNLCAEIVQYSSNDEQSVCNLASLVLPKFVETNTETGELFFNHTKLHHVTKIATRNLNKVIDINYYPTKETRNSNMRHRPIGIGVQGLADVFLKMRVAFESSEAAKLNFEIFETMYHAALDSSCELAEEHGAYSTYEGSPISQGKLQFDLWDNAKPLTDRWNWTGLRLRIKDHGVRNSLLIALMPTASTSQLMGSYECFEPYSQNNGTWNILNGTYKFTNTYMIRHLIELGLWTKEIRNKVKAARHGSIQDIEEIPQSVRDLYKTIWEIPQKTIIDLAADRGQFVCQSQSMNIYYEVPDFGTVATMLMYGWKKGLKTGVYYLRSQPTKNAIKTTVDPNAIKKEVSVPAPAPVELVEEDSNAALEREINGLDTINAGEACTMEEGCISCGA
jgi:ribonucleoside-diphosphate reductase alpha chain